MFRKVLILLILVFVTKFNVIEMVTNKNVVWQNSQDFCYYDKDRAQQYDCAQSRCQQIPNVLVEKRFYNGINELCIAVLGNYVIYNISLDEEYKTNHLHLPVDVGPETHYKTNLISTKINRSDFDPHHLLDLFANITETTVSEHYVLATIVQSKFINNNLIEIFDKIGITCNDIQKSMLSHEPLKWKRSSEIKLSFHTKRQIDMTHSVDIVYEMPNNETCCVPTNIKTLNNSNIAEMVIYRGPKIEAYTYPPYPKNVEFSSPVSVQVNGSEACNPYLARTADPILDNQPNINPLKFYDKCLELNLVRSEPESGYCENLPEVNVRSLILNGDTQFWCVTVDKKLASHKYENDSRPIIVNIEMALPNNFIRWYNKSNSIKTFTETTFIFEVLDRIIISIEPKRSTTGVSIIKSLKINNLESCGLLLDNSVCGVRKIKHRPFIAYGLPTYPGQYPWHVAIYEVTNEPKNRYLCGGSIIGSNAILTAAHCVLTNNRVINSSALIFEAGRFDLRYNAKYTKAYEVVKIVPHEDYFEKYFENDIAILKSKLYIEFNDFVQPICLTSNSDLFDDEVGYVPGWGKNELDERENMLAEAAVPIVDSSLCRASNRDFFQTFLFDGKFCGGYRNGTTLCTGDSGGGLFVEFPTRWFIKGIVSVGYSGNGLCDANQYVLFTDVVYYNNWIKLNLQK